MYLHSMAIHQLYDSHSISKVWVPLLRQLLCHPKLVKENSEAFHRTLGLILELYEIDNPDMFKKFQGQVELPEIMQLIKQCKEVLDPKKYK